MVGDALNNVVIGCPKRGTPPFGGTGLQIGNIGVREVSVIAGNVFTLGDSRPWIAMVVAGTNDYGIHRLRITNNVVFDINRPVRFMGTPGVDLNGVEFIGNVLQQRTVADWELLEFRDSGPNGQTTFRNNTYYSELPANRWFNDKFGQYTLPQWASYAPETGAVSKKVNFPDSSRSCATYSASLGRPATLEAFLTEARKQRKGLWRAEYTASAANTYIRAGFGMSGSN